MKITTELEQFNHDTSLVIVTSNQDMRMYLAHNGHIDRILSLKITKPAYSDHEGFYKKRGNDGRDGVRSGSVLRPVERAIRLEFKRELKNRLKDIVKKYQVSRIILFAPKRNQRETTDLISKNLQQRITTIISGNYFDETPFELIKKITKTTTKTKIIPITESAKKILDKARVAREIVRNPKKIVNSAKA